MVFRLALAAPLVSLPLAAQLIISLSPKTNEEYEAYLAKVEPLLAQSIRSPQLAPWLANNPGDVEEMKKGQIPVRSLTGKNGLEITDGIVHDWVGGTLIPGATIERVMRILQDFDRQKEWYPEVLDSKLVSKSRDTTRGQWVLLKKKVLTLVFRTDLESRYAEVSPGQWYVRSATTSLREIADYGTPKAIEYAQGKGHGFMWRFNSYWALQQRPEGVYATLRVVSLSRDIPTGLGWIVSPFIRSVPMETVQSTLLNTKKAVEKL